MERKRYFTGSNPVSEKKPTRSGFSLYIFSSEKPDPDPKFLQNLSNITRMLTKKPIIYTYVPHGTYILILDAHLFRSRTENTYDRHTCATCFNLPSNISIMMFAKGTNKISRQ